MSIADLSKEERQKYWRERQRAWREHNRVQAKLTQEKAAHRKRQRFELLKQEPCASCGIQYHPVVMNWHHLDPETKSGNVSQMNHEQALQEIQKCVLLCANCHRMLLLRKRPGKAGREPNLTDLLG